MSADPFDAVNLRSGDLSNVDDIDIVIRGQTSDFSVAIGGINVVPEPRSLPLVLFGLGTFSLWRERIRSPRKNGR